MTAPDTEPHTVDPAHTETYLVAPPRIRIKDYRCKSCGRLLFRAHLPDVAGIVIEIRCSKCGRISVIESEIIQQA